MLAPLSLGTRFMRQNEKSRPVGTFGTGKRKLRKKVGKMQ
jgi:hypothetical protein